MNRLINLRLSMDSPLPGRRSTEGIDSAVSAVESFAAQGPPPIRTVEKRPEALTVQRAAGWMS
jgi:hypothetical protein